MAPTEGLNLCVSAPSGAVTASSGSSTTGCGCSPCQWRHLAVQIPAASHPNPRSPVKRGRIGLAEVHSVEYAADDGAFESERPPAWSVMQETGVTKGSRSTGELPL